jgi:hypothetical protein
MKKISKSDYDLKTDFSEYNKYQQKILEDFKDITFEKRITILLDGSEGIRISTEKIDIDIDLNRKVKRIGLKKYPYSHFEDNIIKTFETLSDEIIISMEELYFL